MYYGRHDQSSKKVLSSHPGQVELFARQKTFHSLLNSMLSVSCAQHVVNQLHVNQ